MINQPEPVFSFTIPYYINSFGETSEIFVSEQTYEKYLQVQKKENAYILHGSIHPLSSEYGEVTTTLVDKKKSIVIIGTKDLEEYTTELLDIAIAQEFEKILSLNKGDFSRFLYSENTPELIQIFIDDIQQTLVEIPIAKKLMKQGYRIKEREMLVAQEILEHSQQFEILKKVSPYENEHSLFLLCKLLFLADVDKELFQFYKEKLFAHYPQLFREVERLLKTIQKSNLISDKGREKALNKIFTTLKMNQFIKKVTLNDFDEFPIDLR